MADPVDSPGAMLLFKAGSAQVVESFASTDPYVVNGLVTRWWIREWLTVAGENAATPVRPATRSPHDRSKDHGI